VTRFIAFLRAVNVEGHTVKMDLLRQLFVTLGFKGVDTFIASGNVIFEANFADTRSLEGLIEVRLGQTMGYEIATFIRTSSELAEIASYQPFSRADLQASVAFNVAFLKGPLEQQEQQKLMALRTEIDDFHCHNREVYWLCRVRQSQSSFSNAVLEKTLGRQSTLRGVNTLKKMVAKFPA
jgi:uncharacterized protein (DUF1697 family)